MKASIDFEKKIRPIGKLNGTNNGPIHTYTDNTEQYKDMGVEFVRFHETHSPNTKCVEIPFIFRDFDADENDPANYYFGETDAVIKGAVDAGIEIMYRLGMGTEGQPKIFGVIPKDYAKWARIAEHVIAHYTEGWANGFDYRKNLKYLEIWNEADLQAYWPAEPWPEGRKTFIDFYKVAATHLKKRFPYLSVGCCGWAGLYSYEKPEEPAARAVYESRYEFFHLFLQRVRDEKIPMDFFGWHIYSMNSLAMWQRCTVLSDLLAEFGMEKKQTINTEWANFSLKRDAKGAWYLEKSRTVHSAVGTLGCMIVMQKFGVTHAALYDADLRSKFCTLYGFDGSPGIVYWAMKAWKWIKEGKTEVETAGDAWDFRVVASRSKKTAVAALTNEGEEKRVTLEIKNLPACEYDLCLFDETHRLEKTRRGTFTGRALTFTLPKDSFAVLKFAL